ncbi:MAG: dihydropteroate synthase [Chloroflexi bacterium]|nr:dihydropteroate synthase [Chloroflexota bacterium]
MTTISSPQQAVTIGGGGPTVIIGERINPTNNKRLAAALLAGDFSVVTEEAQRQVAAGAHVIDVNCGLASANEVELLPQAILNAGVETPLSIDFSDPRALEAALKVCPGKPLVNSVSAEDDVLAEILPLVKQAGAAVVGLTMDASGIARDVDGRLRAADKILNAAAAAGISKDDVVIDPLAMAVSTEGDAALVTLECLRRLSAMGVATTLGASNISFGLPDRRSINAVFLAQTIAAGLTSAITDPTVPDIYKSIVIADLLVNRDEFAANYLSYYRRMQRAAKQ